MKTDFIVATPDDGVSARFLTPFDMEDVGDGVHVELLAPLIFRSAELRRTLVAPAGMLTDFASTPPGTREVFPKFGKWARPSVIHDGGYQLELVDVGGQPLYITKAQTDRLFLEAMIAVGVPEWKYKLMYQAVRWFGRGSFDKKRDGGIDANAKRSRVTV